MNAITDASASFHATPRVHRARPVTRSVEDETRSASLRTMTIACYIVAIGGLLLSAGLLSIAAVIGAYLLRADARGTVYESHCRWMIRTGWVTLGVLALAFAPVMVGSFLMLQSTGVDPASMGAMAALDNGGSLGASLVWLGWLIAIPVAMAVSVWFLYRMIKGLLLANDKQPV